MFKRGYWDVFILFAVVLILSACASPPETGQPSGEDTWEITPYLPATSTPFPPTPTIAAAIASPALPTPTPFIYVVVTGDTMSAIASRFGITVKELQAANPTVDPYFMSVGTELVIPSGEGGESIASIATPTPVQLQETNPVCYPTASGGLWCFWLVVNTHTQAVENISAVISLHNRRGEWMASQPALAPINVLQPGGAMPLMAFFEPPVPDWGEARAQLLTALEVVEDASHLYFSGQITDLTIELSSDGLVARLNGLVRLAEGGTPARVVWVLGVAYGEDDAVVGVRRWEWDGTGSPLEILFSFQVFSLGPPIDHVDVLLEARP